MTFVLKMAAPTRKPAPKMNQNDLRQLMKEKQRLKGGIKKIESPLAKYNNLDQLFCILCNSQIKSELLWAAHVSGKAHKENLESLKTKKQDAEEAQKFKLPLPPPPPKPLQSILKRKAGAPLSYSSHPQDKKTKTDSLPRDFFDSADTSTFDAAPSNPSSAPSSSLVTMCELAEANDVEMEESPEHGADGKEQLPADFFEEDITDDDKVKEDAEDQTKSNSVEALPEGFFDDPIKDAKVRKVEYRDPVEEEWEKFQRVIADATTEAQAIIDDEEEESTAERQIDEIEEQIRNWARVDALQRRKEELDVQQKDTYGKNAKDDGDDIDEQEFDEFLDWRSKDSWR